MAFGEILSRAGKMAPSCPLGQPITARDLGHLAHSRSQPYNNVCYRLGYFHFCASILGLDLSIKSQTFDYTTETSYFMNFKILIFGKVFKLQVKLCTFTKIAFFLEFSMTCFYSTVTYINTTLELRIPSSLFENQK